MRIKKSPSKLLSRSVPVQRRFVPACTGLSWSGGCIHARFLRRHRRKSQDNTEAWNFVIKKKQNSHHLFTDCQCRCWSPDPEGFLYPWLEQGRIGLRLASNQRVAQWSLSLHHVARLVVIWLADAGTLHGGGVRREYRLASQKPSRTRHRRVGVLAATMYHPKESRPALLRRTGGDRESPESERDGDLQRRSVP